MYCIAGRRRIQIWRLLRPGRCPEGSDVSGDRAAETCGSEVVGGGCPVRVGTSRSSSRGFPEANPHQIDPHPLVGDDDPREPRHFCRNGAIATVLIIDDDLAVAKSICKVVRAVGHTPVAAHSGEEGLAAVALQVPDVIIIDQLMPGMKGLEVLQVLRSDPRVAGLPIVIHSGTVDPAFEDAAKQSGATEVWVKGLCDVGKAVCRLLSGG